MTYPWEMPIIIPMHQLANQLSATVPLSAQGERQDNPTREKYAAVLERPQLRPTSLSMENGTSLAVVPDAARQANMAKDREERSVLGQFLTPMNIAHLMAGMFDDRPGCIRLLDPGAGAGALTSAFVAAMAGRKNRPERIEATCYEIDPSQLPMLRASLAECSRLAERAGIALSVEVRTEDFLEAGVIEGKLAYGRRYDAAQRSGHHSR